MNNLNSQLNDLKEILSDLDLLYAFQQKELLKLKKKIDKLKIEKLRKHLNN